MDGKGKTSMQRSASIVAEGLPKHAVGFIPGYIVDNQTHVAVIAMTPECYH